VNKLKPGFQVWLEANGKRVFGEQEAKILEGIKKLGSFMGTSRSLGISYAHAWNTIDQASSALGEHFVEARKGGEYGGGAKLTEAGLRILEDYYGLEHQVGEFLSGYSAANARDIFELKTELPEFTVIGSDCVGIGLLVDMMLKKGQFSYEVVSVGSSGGLAAVMLGETDVAGVHLLDEETGEYNISFLKRYWVSDRAVLVRGYLRDIGLIVKKSNPKNILEVEDLLRSDVKFVNRPLGSGTRTLLDIFLRRIGEKKGLKFKNITKKVKGYPAEVKLHSEAAEAVATGKADVAFGIKAVKTHKLDFIPIAQENFDFVIEERRLRKPLVKLFIERLSSREFTDKLREQDLGLRTTKETATIIHRP
jgi:putative molybdopterin biosynthesis protein